MIGAITKIQDWLMDIILKGLAMVYPSSWNFAPAAIAVQFAVKIIVYGLIAIFALKFSGVTKTYWFKKWKFIYFG